MSVDGNHLRAQVRSDLHLARRMSRPGGLLLLDDMITHKESTSEARTMPSLMPGRPQHPGLTRNARG